MYTGNAGQTHYRRYMDHTLPGIIEGMGPYRGLPYTNSQGGAQAVYTVTPPATVDANATYRLNVGTVPIKFTTGTGTTPAQLGAGLHGQIRTDPEAFRLVDTNLDPATGVITLTVRFVNMGLSITANSSDTTNDLVIANTVPPGVEGAVIPFGRFVGRKADYEVDPVTGDSPASLIDNANAFGAGGYEVLGVTMKTFTEKVGRFEATQSGYKFGQVMNVLDHCGTIEGIWTEAVEPDIKRTDPVYISVADGSKVTKNPTGNVDISSRAKFQSDCIQSAGYHLVLVYFNRE